MRRGYTHMVDVLFVLALFCVFAVTSLLVVLFGADVYENIAEDMAINSDVRSSLNYITEKIRQNDGLGNVRIIQKNGEDALLLERTSGADTLQTFLYLEEGFLKEITVVKGLDMGEWIGSAVMEMQALSLTKKGAHLLEARVVDLHGSVSKTLVTLWSTPILEEEHD